MRTGTLLALALAAAAPGGAHAAHRVVVLPFEESSRVRVGAEVGAALAAQLAARRYDPVAGEAVERFLERERVRYVDSLPAPALERLLRELGATRALFGNVLVASERPLLVAVAARLVGPGGQVVWNDVAIVREAHAGGLLGSSKLTTLREAIAEAARALADSAPDGRSSRTAHARGPRLTFSASGGPVSYRARGAAPGGPIAILPPTNYTPDPRAARVVGELLAVRARAHRGVRLVEAAELRQAAPAAELRLSRRLDVDDMKRLQPAVGTHLFLRTTVLRFDPSADAPVGDARVALEMTLVDADTERIVWTAYHERRGDEYVAPLRTSPVHDVVTLANRVVEELVDTLWN